MSTWPEACLGFGVMFTFCFAVGLVSAQLSADQRRKALVYFVVFTLLVIAFLSLTHQALH